jgi:hypothetical protein
MRERNLLYWVLVGVLIVFGVLGAATIGLPFLALGLTLAALAGQRGRPQVFWPVLLLVVGFFVGNALVAPWYCSEEVYSEVGGPLVDSGVVCQSLVGLTYRGSGDYNPSYLPGLLAGLGTALLFGGTAWIVLRRRTVTS